GVMFASGQVAFSSSATLLHDDRCRANYTFDTRCPRAAAHSAGTVIFSRAASTNSARERLRGTMLSLHTATSLFPGSPLLCSLLRTMGGPSMLRPGIASRVDHEGTCPERTNLLQTASNVVRQYCKAITESRII